MPPPLGFKQRNRTREKRKSMYHGVVCEAITNERWDGCFFVQEKAELKIRNIREQADQRKSHVRQINI
jgi:hypothetical protein